MMTYYNEVKEDILEAMEEDYIKEELTNYANAEDAYDRIYELIDNDVTGNIDGSYYCSRYKARQQAYNFSSEVIEALEEYGYTEELEKFKTFEILADEKCIDVKNMTLNDDYLEDLDDDEKESITYDFEEVSDLDFEAIDVITRCYFLNEVLTDVLDEIF